MSDSLSIFLGKTIRRTMLLRGGGSALPGLVMERIHPSFVKNALSGLPLGVVLVSGTNGKTTTTKMVVDLLAGQGLKVFTNRTGSNFVRGVAAALLSEVDSTGKLDADIAVLELDEAHAVKFVEQIPPRYSLLLNVMRDQLDRFGEIDTTARMLEAVAKATTHKLVLNREDPRIANISKVAPAGVSCSYFGLSDELIHHFPSDDSLHQEGSSSPKHPPRQRPSVLLKAFKESKANLVIGGREYTVNLSINGIYNIYNSAAALAMVREILPKASLGSLLNSLSKTTPAFGRGEKLIINGQPLEIILVKNPSGFRLSLRSFKAIGHASLIAINDEYADGRDMSWLWDVDFSSLEGNPVSVSGLRAYDIALRLQYENVPVSNVETNLKKALTHFLSTYKSQPKHIFCTYTAMLEIRKQLSKITDVEVVQ